MNKMKRVKYFKIYIKDKGLTIFDERHKPPRKCGTLSWKVIMELIETEFTAPTIISGR